jgi:hypothetical protein
MEIVARANDSMEWLTDKEDMQVANFLYTQENHSFC